MSLKESLQQYFGFTEFRPGQEQCIKQLLAGQSSLAIFPTGSGKSLCYQFTATQLPNLTLVVSPLLALMKDQVDFLRNKGIAAASLDSSLTTNEYQAVVSQLRQGQLKILMVSVERFKNERFRQMIDGIPISMLVVDEAHCISEWGHNFRPDYQKLPLYQQQLQIPTVLLLTATATRKVKRDMATKFNIQPEHCVQTGFYRSNLELTVRPTSNADKNQQLIAFLSQQTGCGIVYVTLQQQAEDVARWLQQNSIPAKAYHAGLNNDIRQSIQNSFMSGETPIIVATIAFGMGVDKSDIRFVVHYDLPKSIESYSQEIGRAGRDGQQAKCVTFANLDGLNTLENFVYGDTPALWGIEKLLDTIRSETQQEIWELQAYSVSVATNIRLLTLKTLLVQLELRGAIQSKYSYFAEYRFKFLREPDAIVQFFSGERANFVKAVLQGAKRKRIWAEIDIDAVAQSYSADRSRVVKALEYLQDQQCIELEAKGSVDVYAVNSQVLDGSTLASDLHANFHDKESKEIARIQQLIRFFELNRCLSSNLARYFDDVNVPEHCGHCSVCSGQIAQLKKYEQYPMPDTDVLAGLIAAFENHMNAEFRDRDINAKVSSELVTAFLLGLTLPWFGKFKVRSLKGFGVAANLRYTDVFSAVKRIMSVEA